MGLIKQWISGSMIKYSIIMQYQVKTLVNFNNKFINDKSSSFWLVQLEVIDETSNNDQSKWLSLNQFQKTEVMIKVGSVPIVKLWCFVEIKNDVISSYYNFQPIK